MKRFAPIFFVFSVLFPTGCTTFPLNEMHPVGIAFKDSIRLDTKTIPLPEGEWKVIARGKNKDDFFIIYLLKEYEGKKFSYIRIVVDTPAIKAHYGWVLSKELKRNNMLHVVENVNADGKAQDGWCIVHSMIHFNPKGKYPIAKKAGDYIKSNNYVVPNVMVKVGHHLTGHLVKRRYLDVLYFYNLEVEGFPPAEKSGWEYSDWNVMRINSDPKKVDFIERLKMEHTVMHKKIQAGFGDISPFLR